MVTSVRDMAAWSGVRLWRIRTERRRSIWVRLDGRLESDEGSALAASLAKNPVALGRETGARC